MKTGNPYLDNWSTLIEFANPNHDAQGRFAEAAGVPADVLKETEGYSPEDKAAYIKEYQDNLKIDNWVKKNGPELPPKLGGPLWAFEGESAEITRAADEILSNGERDPEFSPGKNEWDTANTILNTLHSENKMNDESLYSGHHRGADEVKQQLEDGSLFFPLVATSPDKNLANVYAGTGENAVAVIYHFPKGQALSQPYQLHENIATGEYQITGHKYADPRHVQIDLKYVGTGDER